MGLAGMFSGTPLANIGGGSSKLVSGFATFLVIVCIAAIIVGIVYFINRRRSYNTLSPIISDRNGATRFFIDYGAYSKDKKTNLWSFKLLSQKEKLMSPPDKCLLVGSNGNNVIPWYQSSAGQLYPCMLEIVKPVTYEYQDVEVTNPDGSVGIQKQKIAKCFVKVIEDDIQLWSNLADEKLEQTFGHKTFWDQYGNQIMFFGAAVLTLALIFMVLKKIDVVQEAARLFNDAAQTLKASSATVPGTAP